MQQREHSYLLANYKRISGCRRRWLGCCQAEMEEEDEGRWSAMAAGVMGWGCGSGKTGYAQRAWVSFESLRLFFYN